MGTHVAHVTHSGSPWFESHLEASCHTENIPAFNLILQEISGIYLTRSLEHFIRYPSRLVVLSTSRWKRPLKMARLKISK
jgi:hypothetical protein